MHWDLLSKTITQIASRSTTTISANYPRKTMKIAALAVVAAIAVANVAAADQPALRTGATPVEAATVAKPADGNNKKEWGWGGPWGGYGWGGGWGGRWGGGWGGGWGGCCGMGGWGW